MTAETWQPGDRLPGVFGADGHDLIEEYDDHEFHCRFCYPWDGQQLAAFWGHWSNLGPHNDTLPPLPWLHGPAA